MSRADFTTDAYGNPEVMAGRPKSLEWRLTTGALIVVRENAEVAATSLLVEALKEALTTADRLRFGEIIVVVASPGAPVGARTVPVDALTGRIERHARGRKVPDASGFTLRFRADKAIDPGADPASLEKTPTGDVNGVISMALTAANTTALGEGSFIYSLDRTDSGDEYNVAFGDILVGRAAPAAVPA